MLHQSNPNVFNSLCHGEVLNKSVEAERICCGYGNSWLAHFLVPQLPLSALEYPSSPENQVSLGHSLPTSPEVTCQIQN